MTDSLRLTQVASTAWSQASASLRWMCCNAGVMQFKCKSIGWEGGTGYPQRVWVRVVCVHCSLGDIWRVKTSDEKIKFLVQVVVFQEECFHCQPSVRLYKEVNLTETSLHSKCTILLTSDCRLNENKFGQDKNLTHYISKHLYTAHQVFLLKSGMKLILSFPLF